MRGASLRRRAPRRRCPSTAGRRPGRLGSGEQGTFYIVARSPEADDQAFVARLAEQHLFVLPGATIVMPGWFRISLTASDAMIEASIQRFAAVRATEPTSRT